MKKPRLILREMAGYCQFPGVWCGRSKSQVVGAVHVAKGPQVELETLCGWRHGIFPTLVLGT